MRKTIAGLCILIAISLIIFGIHWSFGKTSKKIDITQVTVAQAAKTLLYLPLYVAIDRRYARNEGIQVNVITAGGDSQAFAALASGQVQFAQGDPTFVAISHEKGGPGVVVASVLDRVAFWGVTFSPNVATISDGTGFRGLTVVTYPDPNTAYELQKNLVTKAGLHLGLDTSILQATFGTELGPLQAGKAQVAMSIEPTVSQAVAEGARVVFSYPRVWGPFLLTGLMTTEDFANKNKSVVQAVVNSYEQALQFIRQNPDGAVAVGKKYFPEVSGDVIRTAIDRLTSENVFPAHAQVNLDSWRAGVKVRIEIGDLKNANYDGLVDNSFASRTQTH